MARYYYIRTYNTGYDGWKASLVGFGKGGSRSCTGAANAMHIARLCVEKALGPRKVARVRALTVDEKLALLDRSTIRTPATITHIVEL